MDLKDLIQQAREKYGQAPSALLYADQPTGEKPWELFITDEHTEHYLSLQVGDDSDRGMATGLLGGIGLLCSLLLLSGKTEGIATGVALGAALFFVPYLWENRRPLPPPILFNRRTREVYLIDSSTAWRSMTQGRPPLNLPGLPCHRRSSAMSCWRLGTAAISTEWPERSPSYLRG